MPTELTPQTADTADVPANTGLMCAAKAGDLDKLQAWLEAGADVNAVDDGGKTALLYAADGYRQDGAGLVSLLIAFGADMDAIDSLGNSAAMRAALAGKWAMVDLLEALGADMFLANYCGIVPDDMRNFAWEEDDSDLDCDSELYDESAPPDIPGRPMAAPAFEPVGAEGDTGYFWHGTDDVLNQAFDASMLPDAADAAGMHFAGH